MESLKKSEAFKKVYNNKRSVSNRLLVLYILRNDQEINRVGISISRKVGKAVTRNRIKRLIKEYMRLNEEKMKVGYDLVVVVRAAAAEADFREISESLSDLLDKQRIMKQREAKESKAHG